MIRHLSLRERACLVAWGRYSPFTKIYNLEYLDDYRCRAGSIVHFISSTTGDQYKYLRHLWKFRASFICLIVSGVLRFAFIKLRYFARPSRHGWPAQRPRSVGRGLHDAYFIHRRRFAVWRRLNENNFMENRLFLFLYAPMSSGTYGTDMMASCKMVSFIAWPDCATAGPLNLIAYYTSLYDWSFYRAAEHRRCLYRLRWKWRSRIITPHCH